MSPPRTGGRLKKREFEVLSIENSMVVVIDFQGNLAQAMDNKEDLFLNAEKIIRGAGVFGLPILVTEQIPAKLGPTIPEIALHLTGIDIIAKECFSCLDNESFAGELKRYARRQVILSGIETHICVYQTALGLLAKGHEVYVAADACSSRTSRNHEIGIERMREEGVKITCAEMVLFELLKTAGSGCFKDIFKIVK